MTQPLGHPTMGARCVRVPVDAGGMEYSAVTHPEPLPFEPQQSRDTPALSSAALVRRWNDGQAFSKEDSLSMHIPRVQLSITSARQPLIGPSSPLPSRDTRLCQRCPGSCQTCPMDEGKAHTAACLVAAWKLVSNHVIAHLMWADMGKLLPQGGWPREFCEQALESAVRREKGG